MRSQPVASAPLTPAGAEEFARLAAFSSDIGLALVGTDSLPEMLCRCAELMVQHLEGAFARVWTLDSEKHILELRASAGLYTHLDGPHSRVPVGQYKIGLIAQEQQPHLTNSVVGDPRVSDQDWAKREGMVAFAGYPLTVDGRVIGVMAMFARHPLTEATLTAMASVANVIALGIQRKTAEEGRRRTDEWTQVTFASIGDGVITTDLEGKVTFLNGVAEELTGWTLSDAGGRPIDQIFNILHEQTREPVENPIQKVLQHGRIVGLGNHTVLISKNGTVRPIDDSAAPIRDPSGQLHGVVLIFRDVSEQRQAEHELRESEARKSAILDTALDCIITMDAEGRVVEFNPAAERTFGFPRERIIGQPLAEHIIPPSLRERHYQGLAHYLATGEGPVLGSRVELPALRADGTEFPVEIAINRIHTAGPPLFTAYLRDLTETKRREQHRNTRTAVTQALSDAVSADEGVTAVLTAASQHLGWEVALFWRCTPEEDSLRCTLTWQTDGSHAAEFIDESLSRQFKRGEGLPGRVWESAKPVWIADVTKEVNYARLNSAARFGLRSAFACPVALGERALGVMEFVTTRLEQPDVYLIEMMASIAGNVGQFLERKEAEEQVRRNQEELADFFENATVGLHWVGPDGTILRANQAELDLLGYSRDEYIGRPISDFHVDEEVICDILARLKAGEELQDYPARLRCKTGGIKEVLIDSSVRFLDEEFVHTRCFTRDVTERNAAEAKVREQEQQTRRILESITDAFCALDREWRFIYVNQHAEELLGRSREELIGKNHWEEYPDTVGTELEFCYRRAVADGDAVSLEHFYAPHDRWYEVRAYPSNQGLSVYFRDVSRRKRAEQALRESEEKLRLLADTIPQLAWMARPDGHIFWYNQQWHDYTGASLEDMEGWGWQSVHDPERLPEVVERWRASLTTGQSFDMVFPLRGKDGQFRPFLTRVNPLRDEAGHILYWFGTNTDISELKRMEEALRESDQRFRDLADTMPQIVWTAEPDGNIDYLNRRWTELTGLPSTVSNDAWAGIMHPDDAPEAHRRWAASLQGSAPFEMEIRLLDVREQRHRWHLLRTIAIHDSAGRVIRWFGTATDIHEQKSSAEAFRFLAEASAALSTVVDYQSTLQRVAGIAVPQFADWCAVDLVGEEGELLRLATVHSDQSKVQLAEELYRRYPPRPDDAYGAPHVFLTGTSEMASAMTEEVLGAVSQDAEHLEILKALNLRSYICVPMIVRERTLGVLTFVMSESGREYDTYHFRLAEDLAKRAAIAIDNALLYQQLRDNDRRKDEFLATLAHELRNPLAPIRTSLQILQMPHIDLAQAQRSRDVMERQVQQLVRLVDDLLDVSRVMRGKIDLRKEVLELSSVVARAVETVHPLIDSREHALSIRSASESLLVDADAVRLAQAVGNLLTNAAKYTEPRGHITVTSARQGDVAVLSVRDNGTGIAPQMLPHIFDLFVQADLDLNRAHGGLGIGLTLVKNLVEMHNGSVHAQSRGLGKGSEFTIRLPLVVSARAEEVSPGVDSQGEIVSPTGRRLLVVDDNRDAAESLATLLELQGHEVRVAHSGEAALAVVEGYAPDIALLDIGMPGMDGYELARRLRCQPGLEKTVLAALTGWGQPEDRRRTTEAGFDHHLVKPVQPEVLEDLINSV